MYLECAVIILILYSVILGPCTSSTTCQSKYTDLNQNLPLGRNVFSLSAHCALAQSLCVALAPGWGWWWWWGARPAAAAVQWPLVLIGVAFWPLSCFISLIGSKWPPCWLFTSCAGNHMLHTRPPPARRLIAAAAPGFLLAYRPLRLSHTDSKLITVFRDSYRGLSRNGDRSLTIDPRTVQIIWPCYRLKRTENKENVLFARVLLILHFKT